MCKTQQKGWPIGSFVLLLRHIGYPEINIPIQFTSVFLIHFPGVVVNSEITG